MLKTTLVPFRTGTAEKVVIAELAVVFSFFDVL